MQNDLNDHPAVLLALRNFISVGASGSEAAGAMAQFAAETSLLPLRNLEAWEQAIRTELRNAEQSHSPLGSSGNDHIGLFLGSIFVATMAVSARAH